MNCGSTFMVKDGVEVCGARAWRTRASRVCCNFLVVVEI